MLMFLFTTVIATLVLLFVLLKQGNLPNSACAADLLVPGQLIRLLTIRFYFLTPMSTCRPQNKRVNFRLNRIFFKSENRQLTSNFWITLVLVQALRPI